MSQWLETPAGVLGILGSVVVIVTALLKLGAWKGRVDGIIDEVKGLRNDIRDQIRKELQWWFANAVSKRTIEAQSPTRLNDLGKDIARDLNAEDWAKALAGTLQTDAAAREVDEAYEADILAFDVIYGELTDRDQDMSARVSKCAYRRGLSRDDVLAVLQVVLRDALITRLELDEDA